MKRCRELGKSDVQPTDETQPKIKIVACDASFSAEVSDFHRCMEVTILEKLSNFESTEVIMLLRKQSISEEKN